MPGDQFGHLEHADLLLAVEDGFEALISIDEGLLFRVLQAVLLDIDPELFGQLGPWKGFITDNFGQLFVRCNRFHEGRVRCSLCLFWCSSHASVCTFDTKSAI